MAEFGSCIGLDAHKDTIAVAIADGDGGAVRSQGEIPTPRGGAAVERAAGSQRLSGFLPRHGRRDRGKQAWSQPDWRWLGQQRFEMPQQQIVLEEYAEAVRGVDTTAAARRDHEEGQQPRTAKIDRMRLG